MKVIDHQKLIVGEGPVWDGQKNCLYTIDIRGQCIRRMDWNSGTITQTNYPQQIGCIALDAEGRLLAAMERGIYYAETDGSLTPICEPENLKGRRFNDGKVGPDGRFYVGTTDYAGKGAFYRLDPDGSWTELFDQVGCSNGLAWSPDRKTLYYCDSPTKKLEAFDFDKQTGTLSNRRTVMELPLQTGEFDGMCIDAQGQLWAAVWGGHCVLRIDPNTGKVTQSLSMAVEKPSCTAFAGPELNTLVITSAAFETDPRIDPKAGNTFATSVPVAGTASWRYKGEYL